jgi:pRiA4b ORF-3-like protein
VKRAVLVVDGQRSSANIAEIVDYLGCPIEGRSVKLVGKDTYYVMVDYLGAVIGVPDSTRRESRQVNLPTRQVLFGIRWLKISAISQTSKVAPIASTRTSAVSFNSAVGGAARNEDVGGASGYEEFLEVIFQPGHEEFSHFRGWAGGKFHAEEFRLKAVNNLLGRMKWPVRHQR